MAEVREVLWHALLIGMGATALLDVWALTLNRLFAMTLPDYGMVGRWFGHMARGRLSHDRISASPPVQGERQTGWVVHYLIGIAFAAVLLIFQGIDWAHHPTLGPALIVGITSVAAPFLLMQPGMGLGIAASRTPRPNSARLRSLMTHTIFGVALYAAGWATSSF